MTIIKIKAADPAVALAAWRATRAMDRADFCIALFRAGKLTAAEALEASAGAIPAPLEDAISMLPPDAQAEARIRWAGLAKVERNHALVALVAWVPSVDMTDAEVDEVFGWQP